jgi:hypothetical protein
VAERSSFRVVAADVQVIIPPSSSQAAAQVTHAPLCHRENTPTSGKNTMKPIVMSAPITPASSSPSPMRLGNHRHSRGNRPTTASAIIIGAVLVSNAVFSCPLQSRNCGKNRQTVSAVLEGNEVNQANQSVRSGRAMHRPSAADMPWRCIISVAATSKRYRQMHGRYAGMRRGGSVASAPRSLTGMS